MLFEPLDQVPGSRAFVRSAAIEWACMVIFTLELLVRIYIGTVDPCRQLVFDLTMYIDALSVLPFYLEKGYFEANDDTWTSPAILQFLKLLRLLRVLKLLRHYSGWRVLLIALERSWLAIMVLVFAMIMTSTHAGPQTRE